MAEKLPEVKGPSPLKYQTWVLKVSIHCDGCKKKVKRVLQGIEGVYTTEIDSQANKVVVTGNVDANILVRKLLKTGKHAELWPENNSGKSQKNKKKADTSDKTASDENGENAEDVAAKPDKNNESKKSEDGANKQKAAAGVDSINQSSSGDHKGGENEKTTTTATDVGSGSKKKKKKSNGQKGNIPNNNGGGNANDASQPPALVTPPEVPSAAPAAHTFPQHQVYSPLPHYYPHPVYTMSYNTLNSGACMTPIFGDHTDSYLQKCMLTPPPPERIDTHRNDLYDDDEVGCSIM